MRDAFLCFMVAAAVVLLAGFGTVVASAPKDAKPRLGAWVLGGVLLALAVWLLCVVGHAVGVNMTGLTGG